ncbi:tubulin-tyrosine ligase [Coemansia reversa NRRL 1564]|uniref:Tubulin-tyrosine ligase n=1 Tax=Coemansia reversa (strain ATCC 12441 / NRRL 1564) TaxID=763665 RepID=A0A2G5B8A8_COERN|nr:tubulin-tyrosine ligase [Coemansia reversa NRRL 1564]|eukprot:PIA15273.1 tubulin-tyrosine ligase [Coemansia reversa NRRL 1564]
MHWREYERIDWDAVHRSNSVFSNAYCYRKGLIRKAQMAFNIKLHMAKNPDSVLHRGVPETWVFELDDLDYLDEALMECYEVEDGMKANEGVEDPRLRQQFIIKPSLTARGAGIYVFDTRQRLEELLESEFDSDDEDVNSDSEHNEDIREWVIQRYINRPLLLSSHNGRKFHIRVYVLAVGDLKVYVYRHMLALFAPSPYISSAGNLDNQQAHLTNTCLQTKSSNFDESKAVDLFWNLDLSREKLDHIFDQICAILCDTFTAVSTQSTSFQTWSNCLEQFGFDFLVDEDCNAFMLEANAYPDFKQTGEGLKSVVEGFMAASVATAAGQFLLQTDAITNNLQAMINSDCEDLVEVYTHKNKRKW